MTISAASLQRMAKPAAALAVVGGAGALVAKEAFENRRAAVYSHVRADITQDQSRDIGEFDGTRVYVNVGSTAKSEAIGSAFGGAVGVALGSGLLNHAWTKVTVGGSGKHALQTQMRRIGTPVGFAAALAGSALTLGSLGGSIGALATERAYRDIAAYR